MKNIVASLPLLGGFEKKLKDLAKKMGKTL